jgi:hypothetical protein
MTRPDRIPTVTILVLVAWTMFLASLFFAAGQLKLAGAPWPSMALKTARPLLLVMGTVFVMGVAVAGSRGANSRWTHLAGFLSSLSGSTLAGTACLAISRAAPSEKGSLTPVLIALLVAAGLHGVVLAAAHANCLPEKETPEEVGPSISLLWKFSAGYAVICVLFLVVI